MNKLYPATPSVGVYRGQPCSVHLRLPESATACLGITVRRSLSSWYVIHNEISKGVLPMPW